MFVLVFPIKHQNTATWKWNADEGHRGLSSVASFPGRHQVFVKPPYKVNFLLGDEHNISPSLPNKQWKNAPKVARVSINNL